MTRNYKELQAKMNQGDLADNRRRAHEELQRMALEELRSAKQATQIEMAELLDVPQSSISRIEQRADMYVSTLRSYIHAMGGVLQIQAIFPDGGAVIINRFGEYEDEPYVVRVRAESNGVFRFHACSWHNHGPSLATKALKNSGFVRAMKALHVPEPQISAIRKTLEQVGETEIGGIAGQRVFNASDLIAAGFEDTREQ